jgi:transcriptional regulator with XRE-family HTH domain
MAANVGKQIEDIRHRMSLNQTEFARFFKVSAMTVSRWERGGNPPGARELLILGRLANRAGYNGWHFWQLAGITRAECERALNGTKERTARAGS